MAVKWGLEQIEIMTDSATVYGWLGSVLFDRSMIRTKGMHEMLVKRRLNVIADTCKEFNLNVSVVWVQSSKNKADGLTRVRKKWLVLAAGGQGVSAVGMDMKAFVRQIHEKHHLGVDRNLHLVRRRYPQVSQDIVAELVRSCVACSSIDPAPVQWERGDLEVKECWRRLAVDVTHFQGSCYLSLIDCGPSRFVIWRRLKDESAESVAFQLLQIFRERGPPEQLLMDNGLCFRSATVKDLLRDWCVEPVYRCAYRPAGNGIVERVHRTIKRMAARSRGDPLDMVFFYNVTPRSGEHTVPSCGISRYTWRVPCVIPPGEVPAAAPVAGEWKEGDKVFVKPANARCTTPWTIGWVTAVNSNRSLEVNGIPRHVGDVRRVPGEETDESPGEPSAVAGAIARSQRSRRRPQFYGQNVYDF